MKRLAIFAALVALSTPAFAANDVSKKEAEKVLDAIAEAVAVGGYSTGYSGIPTNQKQAAADVNALVGFLNVDAAKIKELSENSYFGVVTIETEETQVHIYSVGKTFAGVVHLGWYTAEAVDADVKQAKEEYRDALTELLKKGDLKTFTLHDDGLFKQIKTDLEGNR